MKKLLCTIFAVACMAGACFGFVSCKEEDSAVYWYTSRIDTRNYILEVESMESWIVSVYDENNELCKSTLTE